MTDKNPPENNPEGWILLSDQLNCIERLAKQRYRKNMHKGITWLHEEPRWHIYKAHDQFSIASYHYRQNELELFEKNMADGLNHLLMAMVCIGNNEGCHPLMSDI